MSGNSSVAEMSFHGRKGNVIERNAGRTWWIAAVVISGVVGWRGAWANQPASDDDGMKLGKRSTSALAPRRPPDAAQTARIKRLIGSLVNISKPDFGLSSTISGDAFAPIEGQGQATALLLTDHKLEQSSALRELVAIGPEALPFLLDSLDDRRATGSSSPTREEWWACGSRASCPRMPPTRSRRG